MKYTEILLFMSFEQLQEKVKGIFQREKEAIQQRFPYVDIQEVGSTAIPGAIGKYDVDLQIRVSQEAFTEVVEWMTQYAEAKNIPEWSNEHALFVDKEMSLTTTSLSLILDMISFISFVTISSLIRMYCKNTMSLR